MLSTSSIFLGPSRYTSTLAETTHTVQVVSGASTSTLVDRATRLARRHAEFMQQLRLVEITLAVFVTACTADAGGNPRGTLDVGLLPETPGDYRYFNGSLCCAKGEGRACCDEDYYGPDDYDGELPCDEHGGRSTQRCLEAGESFDARIPCVHCCQGLSRNGIVERNEEGTCIPAGVPSLSVCNVCGDGVCTAYEECLCPQDCEGGS